MARRIACWGGSGDRAGRLLPVRAAHRPAFVGGQLSAELRHKPENVSGNTAGLYRSGSVRDGVADGRYWVYRLGSPTLCQIPRGAHDADGASNHRLNGRSAYCRHRLRRPNSRSAGGTANRDSYRVGWDSATHAFDQKLCTLGVLLCLFLAPAE